MFEDKNLERILRKEEKYGIDLCFGEDVILLTAEWMAVLPRYRLMEAYRQTLGAIVEALGYIPDNEVVHIVRCKSSEYVITHPMPEVVAEDVGAFLTEPGDTERPVKSTGMKFGIWYMVQTRSGEIYGVPSVGPALGVNESGINSKGIQVREDENTGEKVYLRTDRPREDKDSQAMLDNWAYLEARQWCVWDAEPGEIKGQEDIDDV
ncbi:MAG: hypothetical protein IJT62_05625 [Oscillospiraceae bacterium]|nr:hypothetical protein [Oscillospiraceae bacterium]